MESQGENIQEERQDNQIERERIKKKYMFYDVCVGRVKEIVREATERLGKNVRRIYIFTFDLFSKLTGFSLYKNLFKKMN